jgi:predicted MFS family arabinose efflux permease
VSALAHRNFRLLFAARTISFFGTNLVPIAVAFAVLDLGGSATAVGVAFAARTLAQVSALLVGGVVADRFPRRAVMVGSDAANLAIQTVMGGLLVTGHASVWSVVLLQAAGGAAAAFHSPASTGLVPQTVPAEVLQQANGYMSIARYSAAIFGAAAGGALVATIGAGWAILVDGLTYAASALLLLGMHLPGLAQRLAAPKLLRDLHEGWQAFVEHTWVWLLSAWIAVFFLISYAPFFVLGPYLAKQELGGAGAWATVLTGEAIGSLLGGLAALRLRPARPMLACVLVFTLDSLQLILLAEGAPFGAIAVAASIAGFAFAFGNVIFETALQRTIAPEKLSRVSSFDWLIAMSVLPLGYAIAGPVADAIGASTYLWIGAIWIVVSAVGVGFVPSVRNLRTDVPAEAAPAGAG